MATPLAQPWSLQHSFFPLPSLSIAPFPSSSSPSCSASATVCGRGSSCYRRDWHLRFCLAKTGIRSTKARWQHATLVCRAAAKVTCLGGGKKRDAARKALEDALGGQQDVMKKWDEEMKKKKEVGGGGGGGQGKGKGNGRGRGKGWGSGGGGGGGGGEGAADDENSWEEAKQIGLAFFGLVFLYLALTQGKAMLALALNGLFFVLRGFKRSPSYSPPSSNTSSKKPSLGALALGSAEADVINKWGKD